MPNALVLAVLLVMAPQAAAAPPRVVRAEPDNAEVGVDPGLTSITIEFDQDMDARGRSICGGGPRFPTIDGEVRWADARTVVIPVRLVGGRSYALSVNCPAAGNFRSVGGESAEVYPIAFLTRMPGDAAPVLSPEAAARALANLRRAVDERYSYRDLRGVEWDGVFERLGPAVTAARTPGAVGRAAAKILAAAEDMHITVRVSQFVIATHATGVRANVDMAALPKRVKGWKALSPRVMTGEYDGVPYLLVSDWMGPMVDYEPAIEWLTANADAPAIIVDVRPNSGGDETIAKAVASRFVVEGSVVYSKNKIRDPASPGGWTPVYERKVEPPKDGKTCTGRVAVLMGKACMSSNESFLLMMRHSGGRVSLVGETSYGSSGNPRPVDLGCGVSVVLPTWFDMLPDGSPLEGRGVRPDVEVAWKPGETDPVLEAAAARLREREKGRGRE